jgi:MoxR-like ATPase
MNQPFSEQTLSSEQPDNAATTAGSSDLRALNDWLGTRIIGQEQLVERLLIALLADGHLLVEGAPGLAKTKAVKTLAEGLEGDFHRVQFTPDLLPGDITGTDIYRPEDGTFRFQPGPIFHNLVLADEINRAPAKVQSALLEAMAERQISVGRSTYPLPQLFLVMATQNPIEQEGTYPLPEAQLDRFLLHVRVDYPNVDAERRILQLARSEARGADNAPQPRRVSQAEVFAARSQILELHMAPAVEEYIVQLIIATRQPQNYDPTLAGWIEFGASPRATIALDRCARARAWLAGRDYVSPDDVQNVCADVLRHRLILSFDAEAAGVDADRVIARILELVPVA